MKKRILSMLLVIVMVLSLVPVSALAEGEYTIASAKSSVVVGEELELTANGADATDTVTWSFTSEDGAVVEFSSETENSVKMTGRRQGKVTVKAEYGTKSGVRTYTVYQKPDDLAIIDVDTEKTPVTSLTVGDSLNLGYTCTNLGTITEKSTVWDSSDSTVISVDKTGQLVAADAGSATVTLRFNGGRATLDFTVAEPVPGKLTIKADKSTMYVGKTLQLNAYDEEDNVVDGITWTTSAETTATVDGNGVVTGVAADNVTITAAKDGYDSATFDITVEKDHIRIVDAADPENKELTEVTIYAGDSMQLKAVDCEGNALVAFWNSRKDKATIHNTSGELKGVTATDEGETVEIVVDVTGYDRAFLNVTVLKKQLLTNVALKDNVKTPVEVRVGTNVQLTDILNFEPADVTHKIIEWKSDNERILTIENGELVAHTFGEVTVTGTYETGDGEKTVSFKVKAKSAEGIELGAGMTDELVCGESMELSAVLKNADGEVLDVPVKWRLKSGNGIKNLVELIGNKLTAFPQSGYDFNVELEAYVEDAEVEALPVVIHVIPKTVNIALMNGTENVTGKTSTLNLDDAAAVAGGIRIDVDFTPADARKVVTWQVQDPNGICQHEADSDYLIVKPVSPLKTGSITIIATASDGTGVTAQTAVQFAKLATELKIQNAPDQMRGGDTLTLSTSLDNDKTLSDRSVKWEISGDGAQYATISDKGVLDTSAVPEQLAIAVTATATANPAATDTQTITLCPSVKSITVTMDDGSKVPGKFGFNDGPIQLMCDTYPEGAMGDFKWTSSNESVAVVDEDGTVTFVGAGNVRISCEATDGSKVKDNVYLAVTKTAGCIEIEGIEEIDGVRSLTSGKSAALKATVWMDDSMDEKAGNQNVTWSVVGTDYQPTTAASINSRGRLVAKTVNYGVDVIVIAYSAENKEIYDEYTVTIKPKKAMTFLAYLEDENQILDSTLNLNIGEDANICGMWYVGADNSTDLEFDCTYFTSNSSVASFDEYGVLTGKKSGSATITVRATDKDTGSVYNAKFTVKVANLVGHVEIATPKANYLNSGSTMSLSATAWMDSGMTKKADNQSFTWKVYQKDEDTGDYVTATAASVSSSGKVTAKSVTKNTTVWVAAISKENSGYFDYVKLTIRPKSNYTLRVFYNDAGTERTDTWNVRLGYTDLSNVLAKGYDATANYGAGKDVNPTVTWSTSNSNIIKVVGNKLSFGGKTGKVKVTAKTVVGKTTYTASMYLNVVKPVTGIEVTQKTASQNLYSGKTLLMVAKVTPSNATNKRVLWSFADPDDYNYASINATTGLIRANKGLTEQVTIHVIATATDGSGEASVPKTVTIYPLATRVEITSSIETIDVGEKGVKLEADVYCGTGLEACQNVKWTSSRSSVLAVDQDGNLTAKRRGTATIKAAALDGSGKYATIKVTVQ
ncbi:MAG: Ig-like domain-containing protein [Eubacteriales bacterium]|nr:Ig-like domain-containing protein [Eubacteriales bacterium]